MRTLFAEKSPAADLPYYINLATGDAKNLYVPIGAETISSRFVTDWEGNALASSISVIDSHSGAIVLLRISGGTLGQIYYIKLRLVTSPNSYDDEVFITLYVRHPQKTT